MDNLVTRLKDENDDLIRTLSIAKSIDLNYKWYNKGSVEKSVVELRYDDYVLVAKAPVSIRDLERDLDMVKVLLTDEAKYIKDYLKSQSLSFNANFKGFYLKGEKEEKCFGKLIV